MNGAQRTTDWTDYDEEELELQSLEDTDDEDLEDLGEFLDKASKGQTPYQQIINALSDLGRNMGEEKKHGISGKPGELIIYERGIFRARKTGVSQRDLVEKRQSSVLERYYGPISSDEKVKNEALDTLAKMTGEFESVNSNNNKYRSQMTPGQFKCAQRRVKEYLEENS